MDTLRTSDLSPSEQRAVSYLMELPAPIYDIVTIDDPRRTFLFQKPVGFRNKTHIEYNSLMSGMLPMPQSMVVKTVRCAFLRDSQLVPITDALWATAAIEFNVCNRIMFQRPAWTLAHPAVFLLSPDCLQDARIQGLLEQWERSVSLEPEIVIEPGDFFCASVECARVPASEVKFCLLLEGPRKVAVV